MSEALPAPLSWDQLGLNLAHEVALKSKDPSTKVGAVLMSPDHRQLAIGYNGFPPQIPDKRTWYENREIKYDFVLHAEVNALANCHVRPAGWTLYCTHHPCKACALQLVGNGIARVVCPDVTGVGDLGYRVARDIFDIAGIEVVLL